MIEFLKGSLKIQQKASSLRQTQFRYNSVQFMCKIRETHAFLINGKSVDRYSIAANDWQEMPTLNEDHQGWQAVCTSLGAYVYFTSNTSFVSARGRRKIEKLNFDEILRCGSQW